jgi:hypothetical protein
MNTTKPQVADSKHDSLLSTHRSTDYRVSADHKFLALVDAHFLPGTGAKARLIFAAAALGHEPLKTLGFD